MQNCQPEPAGTPDHVFSIGNYTIKYTGHIGLIPTIEILNPEGKNIAILQFLPVLDGEAVQQVPLGSHDMTHATMRKLNAKEIAEQTDRRIQREKGFRDHGAIAKALNDSEERARIETIIGTGGLGHLINAMNLFTHRLNTFVKPDDRADYISSFPQHPLDGMVVTTREAMRAGL
jgi:hypothetical protein